MNSKILNVFYGADYLPYKDEQCSVHFPIVGGVFLGSSDISSIRFYYNNLGDDNVTWVAEAKRPDGRVGSQVLSKNTTYNYAELSLSTWFTEVKGDLYISLKGFQGGVQFTEVSAGVYQIIGNPVVLATGAIKIAVNYTPIGAVASKTEEYTDYAQILAGLGDKIDEINGIIVVDNATSELASSYQSGQVLFSKHNNQLYVVHNNSIVRFSIVPVETISHTLSGTITTGLDNLALFPSYLTYEYSGSAHIYEHCGTDSTYYYFRKLFKESVRDNGSYLIYGGDVYIQVNKTTGVYSQSSVQHNVYSKSQSDNLFYTKIQVDTFVNTKADKVGPLPSYDVSPNDSVDTFLSTNSVYNKVIVLNVANYTTPFIGTFRNAGAAFLFEFEHTAGTSRYAGTTSNKTFVQIFSDTYKNDYALQSYVETQDTTLQTNINKSGHSLVASMDSSTYVMTLLLKDKNNNTISTQTIDLPLESIITDVTYYDTYTYQGTTYTKVLVITYSTTSTPTIVPVGDLVSGLVSTSDLATTLQSYYTKTESNNTFVPQTRTVVGIALSNNVSASDIQSALFDITPLELTERD